MELPTESAAVVARFQQRGGTVLRDREDFDTTSAESLRNKLQPPEQIEPASPQIVLGAAPVEAEVARMGSVR